MGEVGTFVINAVEVAQDGLIYIKLINGPFLFREGAAPQKYKAGLDLAIERGWLVMHESGTYVSSRRRRRRARNAALELMQPAGER